MVCETTVAQICKDGSTGVKRVNQYQLVSEAGRGTFSKVMWANNGDGECFAMKVFSRAVLENQVVARFDRNGATTITRTERVAEELRILRGLNHQHLVALLEVIDDPRQDKLFAVFEGVTGGQLMTWENACPGAYSIHSDPLAVKRHWGEEVVSGARVSPELGEVVVFHESLARFLFRQLLDAVTYLHERLIVHKDLKPDNILLSSPVPDADMRFSRNLSLATWPQLVAPPCTGTKPDGVPVVDLAGLIPRHGLVAKVCDLNIAVSGEDPRCLIYDAEGTHLFTPPECFGGGKDEGILGRPRDAWSLGAVLFVMLFGRCPFWHTENFRLQLMILEGELVLPSGLLSASVEGLLRSLLETEPSQRLTPAAALQHPWFGDCADDAADCKDMQSAAQATLEATGVPISTTVAS